MSERVWRKQSLVGPMVCLAGLVLYLVTLAPTVLWGDDAKFQRMAYFLELKGDEMHHPLWVAVAHLFTRLPLGDVAYRTNLLSAVAAAATLYFVYRIVLDLSGSHLAAVVAASALGVSHTFWLHAVRAEVYTLNTLFLAGLTYLLMRWGGRPAGLCLFAFLYGLSLVNHLMMAFALPGYLVLIALRGCLGIRTSRLPRSSQDNVVQQGVHTRSDSPIITPSSRPRRSKELSGNNFVLFPGKGWPKLGSCSWTTPNGKRIPAWVYAGAAVAFLLGLAPYLILVAREGTSGRLAGIALGTLSYVLRPTSLGRDLALFTGFLSYQFVGVALLLGIVGLWTSFRSQRSTAIALLVLYLGDVAFTFDLKVPDQYQFYLPSYVIFALWVGLGTAWLLKWRERTWLGPALLAVIIAVPVLTYWSAPRLLRRVGISHLLNVRDFPGRPALEYHLWPPKNGYYGARQFAERALDTVPSGGIIIADFALAAPMWYLQQVEGFHPDVWVTDPYPEQQLPLILQNYRTRPVFLAHTERYYDMAGISQYFDVLPVGPIYRLASRR